MSNFTVSARKYRPGVFESVVGQDHVTQTLRNAIRKNHLGQAFLFCGPRGVGKTTSARILAKAINCENISADGEPCNECSSCSSFLHNQSFNIYELDAASNNSVDDIRALVEQVRYAPQHGKYKVYIIDEVHMLSTAAFNAFLKTLEEPPSYAIFILATTERHKILPTILSRCQVFDFHRINVKQAIGHLRNVCEKEGIRAEEEALYVIAQKADGALRDALSIFDRIVSFSGDNITYKDVIENLNILDYEYYFKATDYALSANLTEMLLLFDKVLVSGFDPHNFLSGLSEHLRNLLVCKDPNTIRLLEVSETVQARYMEQAQQANMSFLLSGLNLLNQFDLGFKSSKNQRLHVELALMKLSHLSHVVQGAALLTGAAHEKKKPQPVASPTEAAEPEQAQTEAQAPVASATVTQRPLTSGTTVPKASAGALDPEALKRQWAEKRAKEAIQQAASVNAENASAQIATDIKDEDFKRAWEAYVEDLRQRNKSLMLTAAQGKTPQRNTEGLFLLRVENQATEKFFNDDRSRLGEVLAQNGAQGAQVIFEVIPMTEEERKQVIPMRSTEKLQKMAELNPAFADMRQRLGLTTI